MKLLTKKQAVNGTEFGLFFLVSEGIYAVARMEKDGRRIILATCDHLYDSQCDFERMTSRPPRWALV